MTKSTTLEELGKIIAKFLGRFVSQTPESSLSHNTTLKFNKRFMQS